MSPQKQEDVPRTGWTDGLSQDYNRKLAQWFSSRLTARQDVRKAFPNSDEITYGDPNWNPLQDRMRLK